MTESIITEAILEKAYAAFILGTDNGDKQRLRAALEAVAGDIEDVVFTVYGGIDA